MSNPAEILAYENRLKSDDELERADVCNELSVVATLPAAKLLIGCLYDRSPYVRETAAAGLIQIADGKIAALLLELLRGEDVAIRSQAMSILCRVGDQALAKLVESLKDKDDDVRVLAATVLGETGNPSVADAVAQALKDKNPNVRYAAAEALGKVGNSRSIDLLIRTVEEDPYLAFPATQALGFLGADNASDLLIDLVNNDAWLSYPAIEALGNIGSAKAVDAITRQLQSPTPLIQRAAVTALAKIEAKSNLKIFPKIKLDLIEPLMSALDDEEAQARLAAVTALGWIGKSGQVRKLIPLLDDADEEIQATALDAIKRIAATDTPGFLAVMDDPNILHRESLIGILGEIDRPRHNPQLLDFLLARLKDQDKVIRASAARSLGRIREQKAIPALIGCLDDDDGNVRREAIDALGHMAAVGAGPKLMELLNDPYQDVRLAAAVALGKIGSHEIINRLVTELDSEKPEIREAAIYALRSVQKLTSESLSKALGNTDPKVRRIAVGILAERGPSDAASNLVNALVDEDWQVRKLAAQALGAALSPEIIEPLVSTLADENMWVRYAATLALGNLRLLPDNYRHHALDRLIEHLNTDEDSVKMAAVKALAQIGDAAALDPILTLAASDNEDIRQAVADALGEFSEKKSKMALTELLKDENPMVREAADRSLVKKGGKKMPGHQLGVVKEAAGG